MAKAKSGEKSIAFRLILVGIAAAIILLAYWLPSPADLTFEGKMAIAIMLAGLVLWVTEPIPIAITGLVLMAILPVFNILPFNGYPGVWTGFIASTIFFILASFGITAALLKTKIPMKLVFALVKLTKGNTKLTVLAFIIAASIISPFISNLPLIALFAGIAMSSVIELEQAGNDSKEAKNLGKVLMIGITYAVVMSGQITPAGSGLNVMTINMLTGMTAEAGAPVNILFLDWFLMSAPVSIIMIFVGWLSVIFVWKTNKNLSDSTMKSLEEKASSLGKFEALDWKVLLIFLGMIVCWIASNWTGWDLTAIAVIGLGCFFIPGIDVLKWNEYMASVQWTVVILIGSVNSIAMGIRENGGASWMFSATVGKLAMSATAVVAATAFLLPLIRLIIPVGPAVIGISLPPLVAMAPALGASVTTLALIIATSANASFLLGLDPANMMSFKFNQWKMMDFVKAGIVPTIVMAALHTTLLPLCVSLVGY